MVAIIDYGVGNLFSLKSSFAAIGQEAVVTGEKKMIESADKIILPGVGAFGDASDKLESHGLDTLIKDQVKAGKPLLGICLGMQLLFDKSYEYGVHEGLSLISGDVLPIDQIIGGDLKIPHIGWNQLIFKKDCKLFKYINNGDCVYFVHSYYAKANVSDLAAVSCYGAELTAAVERENVFGCQFHPEKSGEVGLNILKAFCEVM